MRYLTDSHTMKAVDNCSIHEFGIPSVVLMERAALGVSAFLRKHAEHNNKKTGIKVVCVCGSGNNGADGLAAAYSVRRALLTSLTSFSNATSIPSGS